MRALLVLAFMLAGCNCQSKVAELDRLPMPTERPVELTKLAAQLTTAMRLGSGVTIDSSSPKNSVGLSYVGTPRAGWEPGAALATRYACRIGELVWAGPYTTDAAFDRVGVGDAHATSADSFIPHRYAAGPPTACEWSFRYSWPRIDAPAPFPETEVGRVCWTNDTLTAGECPESTLARPEVSGRVRIEQFDAGFGDDDALGVAGAFTVGRAAGPNPALRPIATCTRGERPPRTSGFSMFGNVRDFRPGETLFDSGTAFQRAGIDGDSAQCTIELRYSSGADESFERVASYCLGGGSVRNTACDGVAPGPVDVRVEAAGPGFQATLVRGAHHEGPFALAAAPTVEELTPLIASIQEAHDEGARITVADGSLVPQGVILAIVDALRAQRFSVALSVPEDATPADAPPAEAPPAEAPPAEAPAENAAP